MRPLEGRRDVGYTSPRHRSDYHWSKSDGSCHPLRCSLVARSRWPRWQHETAQSRRALVHSISGWLQRALSERREAGAGPPLWSMSERDLVVHVAMRGHLGLAGLAGGGAVFGRPLRHLVWIDPVDDVERRRATGPGLVLQDVDQLDERHLAWMLLDELDILTMQPTEGSPEADRRTHQGAPEVLAGHLHLEPETLLPTLTLRHLTDVLSHRDHLRLGCRPRREPHPAVLDAREIECGNEPVGDVDLDAPPFAALVLLAVLGGKPAVAAVPPQQRIALASAGLPLCECHGAFSMCHR